MFPYIREFPPFERKCFWLQCDQPTTLCRISTYLRSINGDRQLSTRYSKPHEGFHAELTALEFVTNELKHELPTHYEPRDQSVIFDLNMRINNSPCSKCQGPITQLLLEIKSLIPNVPFRFILFFSNLYCGELEIDETMEVFSKWVIELIQYGIVVIMCPLIVYKMVPKPEEISADDVDEMVQLDRRCIDNFRGLLEEFDHENNPKSCFDVLISHKFFRADYDVYMRLFSWEKLHYISIFPKGIESYITKLVIELPKFMVKGFTPLHKKPTRSIKKTIVNVKQPKGKKDISKRLQYPRKV